MTKLLTDDDVFGTAPQGALLSDDDVFGTAPGPAAAGEAPGRTVLGTLGDVGTTALKAAIGLPQALVGLADIPTLGRAGKALESIGFRPGEAQKIAEDWLSPAQQAANQKVADADGFIDTAKAALQNPSTIATTVGESLPQMAAGGLIGRGILAVAPKVAPWLAGAAGEGVLGAGSAATQIREETADRVLTPGQAVSAVASGLGTAALGAAGGKLASRAGLADVDTMIASGKFTKSPASFMRQIVGSGISEGVFEELPQSIQEQMWQNYALDRPLDEGVDKAAAMGLLSGAAMGGAGGGFNAAMAPRAAAAPAPAPAATNSTAAVPAPAGQPTPPAAPAAPEQLATADTTDAERALREPVNLTALDRAGAIGAEMAGIQDRIAALPPEAAEQERLGLAAQAAELQSEHDSIAATWPTAAKGAPTSFSTESGVKLDGEYALIDADDLVTSHNEALRPNPIYPQELQPRDRSRDASALQVSGIVQKLDPARLGVSGDAATGAPIVGADGLVESGNARTIALKRVYQAKGQKAEDYKQWLRDTSAQFGLDPQAIDGMAKPVLVRVRSTPVNRAEFARQANASTVARMAPSEQALSDSRRLTSLEGLNPDDDGDISTSRDFIRQFMATLPITEQSDMIEADGGLSTSGYRRIQNAVLARAYGDSPTLRRMTESLDNNLANVSKALVRVAPTIAAARERMEAGTLHEADIAPDLLQAVEGLSALKDKGWTAAQELGQPDLTGPKYSPEAAELLQFLADNARSPRRIAEFLQRYYEALEQSGDPSQPSMFDDDGPAPARTDLLKKARGTQDGETAQDPERGIDRQGSQPAAPDGRKPEDAARGSRGDEGDGAAKAAPGGGQQGQPEGQATVDDAASEWVAFPADSGTLGIARADMPQIRSEHRSALAQFLRARGIDYVQEDVPASDLKPTQAEFSTKKVAKAVELGPAGERSVLVAADGYVLDGHHQWLAHQEAGTPVPVLRFAAPILDLLAAAAEFPSATASAGATSAVAAKPSAGNRGTFAPANLGIAQESTNSYAQRPYETDLFGASTPTQQDLGLSGGEVSGRRRADRPAGSKQPPVRGDVRPAPPLRDTEAPDGSYFVNTYVGTEATRKLGQSEVRSAAQAAAATRYLYESAVERFDGIVTDANGKPLAVVGGFKGALSQTSVYPATLMGEAVRIPGAAKIWFSHNHPSGNAELSTADIRLFDVLLKVFEGSGIEPMGLLAVGKTQFQGVDGKTGLRTEIEQIPPADPGAEVPVVERKLAPDSQAGAPVDSPARAKVLAKAFYNRSGGPGMLLLNAQTEVVGWVPFSDAMKRPLRGGALNAIYRAVSQANAGSAILVHGGELGRTTDFPDGRTASANIAAALQAVDVSPLDAIDVVEDTSAAEFGLKLAASTVLSRARDGRGMPVAELQALTDLVRRDAPNLPTVHVLADPSEAPFALRAYINRQDAWHDVEGAMHEGDLYLFASGLQDAARAEHVLLEHEAGHFGLRAVLGPKGLKAAMRMIWSENPRVRRAATKLQERGSLSDLVATEEVIVDIPSAELVSLKGWRKVVLSARDWLASRGYTRIADQLTKGLDGSLTDQQRADLFVADLMRAARDFVRGRSSGAAAGTLGVTRLARRLADELAQDEEAADIAKARVLQGEPVADLAGYAAPMGYPALRAWAAKLFEDVGGKVTHPVLGDVVLDGRSVKDSMGHRMNPFKAEAFAAVPEVLRRGVLVLETQHSREGSSFYVSAPVRIRGIDDIVTVLVRRDPNSQRMYLHSVATKKSLLEPLNSEAGNPEQGSGQNGRSRPEDEAIVTAATKKGLPKAWDSGTDATSGGVERSGKVTSGEVANVLRRLLSIKLDDMAAPRLSRAPSGQTLNQAPPSRWQALKSKADKLISAENVDKFLYEFQDKLIDLKRLREHIQALGGTINDLNDAYQGEELYHKRVAKRTEDFLNDELKPLLAEMRSRGVTLEQFEQYLHARHAPEANKELSFRNPNQAMIDAGKDAGDVQVRNLELALQKAQASGAATSQIERALMQAMADRARWHGAQAFRGTEDERLSLSGMGDAQAAAVVAGLSARRQRDMADLAAKVDAINAKTLESLKSYGLMDAQTLDAWKATYQHYVPLHRDEAHADSVSHPIGQGYSVKGDAGKRRAGSNAKVTHILGHIAMQRESALTRGEKNMVGQKLYLMAAQNPDADWWQVDRPAKVRRVDPDTGLVVEAADPMYKNRPNVLMVRIAGKDAAVMFNERNERAARLAESLKNLDGGELHVVMGLAAKGTRWFSSVNTQYNPVFGIINFTRDVQGALLNLGTTPLRGKEGEVFRGMWPALAAIYRDQRAVRAGGKAGQAGGQWGALWNEMQDAGGMTGYRDLHADPKDRAKALEKVIAQLERGNTSKFLHGILDWLSDYNETMEGATRLAAYKVAVDGGMSRAQAASLAKNLTVNFNRKGRQAREIGALYAFFNAAVQGSARMVETFRGPTGKKIMAGGVLLGAMNAMIGMAVMGGGDDDDEENGWHKIPEFVRERSLVIPLGREDFVAIPLPLGFNVLPNIGRIAVEAMAGVPGKSRGAQLAEMLGMAVNAFNPFGAPSELSLQQMAMMVSPTVVDPALSLLINQDWTGKPIYRADNNRLDPTPGHLRAKDSASTPSKAVSLWLNNLTGGTDYRPGLVSWSPDQLDYVIGQITGGVGRELLKANQAATAPFTGDELPAHKIPLIGRIYGNTRGATSESGRYSENVRELNEIENELKGRMRDGADPSAYRAQEPLAALVGRGNAAERQVQQMRKQRQQAVKAGDTARAEDLNEKITEVMKDFNRDVLRARRAAETQ